MGRRAAASLVVPAYAWWVVSLQPFSGTATAAVVLSAVGGTVAGRVTRRPERRPASTARTGAWGALAALAVGWEVLAFVQHPRADHPTVSSLANSMLDSQPARVAAFVLWLLAMVELARR